MRAALCRFRFRTENWKIANHGPRSSSETMIGLIAAHGTR